jgi:hypothetical protein
MTPTYDLIASNVLTSPAASVTFSSIPATYRDLVVVINGDSGNIAPDLLLEFNGDTTNANYSYVYMQGSGSATFSLSGSTRYVNTLFESNLVISQIMDYSATNKHKTTITRSNSPEDTSWGVGATASRWANTSAINSVRVISDGANFTAGYTFYIYGISA